MNKNTHTTYSRHEAKDVLSPGMNDSTPDRHEPNRDEHAQPAPPPRAGAEPSPSHDAMNTYQTITDTVTGVNVRGSDNLIQLLAVVVFTVIGALIGAIVNYQSPMMIGLFGFGGLVAGILLSGAVIGVYRLVKSGR